MQDDKERDWQTQRHDDSPTEKQKALPDQMSSEEAPDSSPDANQEQASDSSPGANQEQVSDSSPDANGEVAAQIDPILELPEIPTAAETANDSFQERPVPPRTTRQRRSGWKMFVAAVALVALGAGVGSATTWVLASQLQSQLPPIGYLWESSGAKPVVQIPQEGSSVVPDIYRRVAPSVVSITVSDGRGSNGNGSGFVVDTMGYILTNYHVIDGASRIQAKFADGTILEAKVVGSDRYQDMAVIKVDPGNRSLVASVLGDSSTVQVGELAIAIGSPFRQENTVTAGIISGINRDLQGEGNPFLIHGVIQTDAAINPGNSGGPLLNARGEVIGINTAIDSPVRANVGIGFAVPINAAKEILPTMIAGEQVQYAYLGVSMQDLNASVADQLGLDVKAGALIIDVYPDTPAANAGLRPVGLSRSGSVVSADVVVEIDGAPIRNSQDLTQVVQQRQVGDEITMTVLRGSERLKLTATLMARPERLPVDN